MVSVKYYIRFLRSSLSFSEFWVREEEDGREGIIDSRSHPFETIND